MKIETVSFSETVASTYESAGVKVQKNNIVILAAVITSYLKCIPSYEIYSKASMLDWFFATTQKNKFFLKLRVINDEIKLNLISAYNVWS